LVKSHETSREFSIYAQNYVDETIALKFFKHDWHTNDRISQQHQKFQQQQQQQQQQQKKQSKPVANLNASKATKSPITLFKKVNYLINLTFKKKMKLYS
jgi:transcription initiation factor TFIID subunit TAF12